MSCSGLQFYVHKYIHTYTCTALSMSLSATIIHLSSSSRCFQVQHLDNTCTLSLPYAHIKEVKRQARLLNAWHGCCLIGTVSMKGVLLQSTRLVLWIFKPCDNEQQNYRCINSGCIYMSFCTGVLYRQHILIFMHVFCMFSYLSSVARFLMKYLLL